MNEEWKDIPGYEGFYSASNQGRIYSMPRKGSKGGIRKQTVCLTNGGYSMVKLCKEKKEKTVLVSHLIWETFNGPIPEGYEVNHINENKQDNRLENLNLMTRKENCNWGTRNRRMAKAQSKMVEQHTLDGTHICTWFSVRGLERELGYNSAAISSCCNGKKHFKTAYGYIWKYAE